eukprot:CAMPEP_0114501074 /NCGR_PEP_ID=MMETSP0109-20121206/8301_1 /TAXON_ID=29199 /ORGANISM="Chlorarachnion reptans, Strain CCCM449" /LENGTH=1425 /DNA_ID=CAMNT_0001678773 /DNA_START=253 /DNA_END=4530 /DNA_ORIENTATION=-
MASLERKYITPRLVSNWDKGGRAKILETYQKLSTEAKAAVPGDRQSLAFKSFVMEMVLHSCESDGHSKEICEILKQSDTAVNYLSQVAIVDALWLLNMEVTEENLAKGLVSFAKLLRNTKLIPSWLMHERLARDMLHKLGIADEVILLKKERRVRTRASFQQIKFNLFREESEGWAKLIQQALSYTSTHEPHRLSPKHFLGRLYSLMGYFDLDPNRVLDILLEAFESQLWSTDNLDHGICKDMCEVLSKFKPGALQAFIGFKLQFYHKESKEHPHFAQRHSSKKNSQPKTPHSLLRLIAVLVLYKQISLEQVWAYMCPSDDDMLASRKEFVKDKMERAQKVRLVTLSADVEKDYRGTQQDFGKNNQKVEFLYQALVLGDWETAKKILTRLKPIMVASDDRISRKLCDFVAKTIEKQYEIHCSLHRLLKDSNKPKDSPVSKDEDSKMEVDQSCGKDEKSIHSANNKSLEMPESLEDLPKIIWQILQHLSVFLHRDTILFSKLCRIFRCVIEKRKRNSQSERGGNGFTVAQAIGGRGHKSILSGELEKCIEEVLLPAFSLLPSNPALATEVWNMFTALPYWERYQLYGFWLNHGYDLSPEMVMQKALSIVHVGEFKRKCSNSNTKDFGKYLIKVAFSNPMIVFEEIVQHVAKFENLVKSTLESFRYMHPMSLDCMIYLLLLQFSKEETRINGLNPASWYKNLTHFCGLFFRKYPETELASLMQYVINRLKEDEERLDENCMDMDILKELMSCMAGIDVDEELGEEQLKGQSGGPVLQSETATFRQFKNKKKGTKKMLDCLLKNHFLLPLLILISQCKTHLVFNSKLSDLTQISELVDRTQSILMQLGEFVQTYIPKRQDYAKHLPSLYDLVKKYHLDPADAFFIARPVLDIKHIQSPPEHKAVIENASPNEDMQTPKESKPLTPEDELKKKELAAKQKLLNAQKSKNAKVGARTSPGKALVATSKLLLPEDTWNQISPEFYTIFWKLSLYDLDVPEALYKSRIEKLRGEIDKIEGSEKDDGKRKREKDKIHARIEELKEELRVQQKNHANVLSNLRKQKGDWLRNVKRKDETGACFIQHCILPRCWLTPSDALYCAKFLDVILELSTPHFSVVHFLDTFIKTIPSSISSCTKNEASRLGRLLSKLLKSICSWKDSEKQYRAKCATKAGFVMDFFSDDAEKVTYHEYCKVVVKWMKYLYRTFCVALASSTVTHKMNTLKIMGRIVDSFPRTTDHGQQLTIMLKAIYQKEEKKEIPTALGTRSKRMYDMLKGREKTWKDTEYVPPKQTSKKIRDSAKKRKTINIGGGAPKKIAAEDQPRKAKSTGQKTKENVSKEERGSKRRRPADNDTKQNERKVLRGRASKSPSTREQDEGDMRTGRTTARPVRKRGQETNGDENIPSRKRVRDNREEAPTRRRGNNSGRRGSSGRS